MGPSGFQTIPILRASPIIGVNHVKAAGVSRSDTMMTKVHTHSPTLTARYRGSIRQEAHIKLLKICGKAGSHDECFSSSWVFGFPADEPTTNPTADSSCLPPTRPIIPPHNPQSCSPSVDGLRHLLMSRRSGDLQVARALKA